MWVTPVGEVHAIQALAKPGVALGVICIPGHIHIALDIKRRGGEWLQHTQELASLQQSGLRAADHVGCGCLMCLQFMH